MIATVLIAAVALLAANILATVLTVAESRGRAKLASTLAIVSYLTGIAATTLCVTTFEGDLLSVKAIAMAVAVSIANYAGTYAGMKISARWVPVGMQLRRRGFPGLPPRL